MEISLAFFNISWPFLTLLLPDIGQAKMMMIMSHCKKVTWDYRRSDHRLDGGPHSSQRVIFKYFWKTSPFWHWHKIGQAQMMMSHCKKVTWNYMRSNHRLDKELHSWQSVFAIFSAKYHFWRIKSKPWNIYLSKLSSKWNFIITESEIFAKESNLSNQILQ